MAAPVNPGVKLALGYLALCLLAGAYVIWSPGAMELAGVLLVLLGLPWSLIGVGAVIAAGGSSAWIFTAAVVGAWLLNAWLLYRIGRYRGRVNSRETA